MGPLDLSAASTSMPCFSSFGMLESLWETGYELARAISLESAAAAVLAMRFPMGHHQYHRWVRDLPRRRGARGSPA